MNVDFSTLETRPLTAVAPDLVTGLNLLAQYDVDFFEAQVRELDWKTFEMVHTQTAELDSVAVNGPALNMRTICYRWLLHAAQRGLLPETSTRARVLADGPGWRQLRSLRMALGMINVTNACVQAWQVSSLRTTAQATAYQMAALFGFSLACVAEKYRMWHLCAETEGTLESIKMLFANASPHQRSKVVRSFMVTALRAQGVQRPFMRILEGCRGDWFFDVYCDHRDHPHQLTGCVVCGSRAERKPLP